MTCFAKEPIITLFSLMFRAKMQRRREIFLFFVTENQVRILCHNCEIFWLRVSALVKEQNLRRKVIFQYGPDVALGTSAGSIYGSSRPLTRVMLFNAPRPCSRVRLCSRAQPRGPAPQPRLPV